MINAVDEYEKYIKKLKNELFKKFFARIHDHKMSETLTSRMIDEFGIKEV